MEPSHEILARVIHLLENMSFCIHDIPGVMLTLLLFHFNLNPKELSHIV